MLPEVNDFLNKFEKIKNLNIDLILKLIDEIRSIKGSHIEKYLTKYKKMKRTVK